MRSRVAALIFTLMPLLASSALVYGQDNTSARQDKPQADSTTANESSRVREDKARGEASPRTTQPSSASSRKGRSRARSQHPLHDKSSPQSSVTPFTLVSTPPEYLSGEANVTVKGNENPIVRLGLARSGVTLVEFPSSDRFFALHPGNSDMVTIDESPTKQNDHFFVFRAGSNFALPASSRAPIEPSASIMAQMRSGMVVTFLIYPVRELTQMAHRVVILYDRADVVAARRAAGLAVNLEESQHERQEHSIRIGDQSEAPTLGQVPGAGNSPPLLRPRTVGTDQAGATPGDRVLARTVSADPGQAEATSKSTIDSKSPSDIEAEARKALKLVITSSKLKNWTRPVHGLSIATTNPKDFKEKDGSTMVIVAISNVFPEPIRLVTGQPDLSVETRDEQGKKSVLVERIKPLHIESSGLDDSIPAGSTLYYAITYRRPVLGVHQRLRVAVSQINAADEPAVADLATSAK